LPVSKVKERGLKLNFYLSKSKILEGVGDGSIFGGNIPAKLMIVKKGIKTKVMDNKAKSIFKKIKRPCK
jgi:hypothetical protein